MEVLCRGGVALVSVEPVVPWLTPRAFSKTLPSSEGSVTPFWGSRMRGTFSVVAVVEVPASSSSSSNTWQILTPVLKSNPSRMNSLSSCCCAVCGLELVACPGLSAGLSGTSACPEPFASSSVGLSLASRGGKGRGQWRKGRGQWLELQHSLGTHLFLLHALQTPSALSHQTCLWVQIPSTLALAQSSPRCK